MSSPKHPSAPPPNTVKDPQHEDEDYESSDDADFDPSATTAVDDAVSSSEDDDETATSKPTTKKRKVDRAGHDDGADLDFDNSGDEATIRKGKRKRGAEAVEEDEEGGEGGLVKTRAQRAKEHEEKKPLASTTGATVDVDALWASMMAPPTTSAVTPKIEGTSQSEEQATNGGDSSDYQTNANNDTSTPAANAEIEKKSNSASIVPESSNQEEMITIKRAYDFAGETITEEKQVPKSSAEARLFLESQQQASPSPKPALRRPKKRVSMFEPNPSGTVKGLANNSHTNKGPKLNTIEKSKLDWAGFVDREGIKDELDVHSRAKEGYLNRMDFLGRVEANQEEAIKQAKPK
ncbi:MAG: swr complex subunit [Piccolia ochrophora]|nr:MAG: swr complex subunit [Piccolia ochrophora]